MTQETTYRKHYRAYPFEVPETRLDFDIRNGETVVRSELTVVRKQDTDEALVLDGVDIELRHIAVDGVPLEGNEYSLDDRSLTIFNVPNRCRVELDVAIHPEDNTALEGLYKSRTMFCTQCEPEGFRHITYYPDRPDVLSRFTTTLTADAENYPVLLANGNRIASGRRTMAGGIPQRGTTRSPNRRTCSLSWPATWPYSRTSSSRDRGARSHCGSFPSPTTSASATSPWRCSNAPCAGTRNVSVASTTSTCS